jgi:hypothetical protein
MKTYGGVEVELHVSWPRHYMEVSDQLHASAALPTWKSPRYSLDRRLGEPQSRYGCCGEKKNPTLPGIEPGSSSL